MIAALRGTAVPHDGDLAGSSRSQGRASAGDGFADGPADGLGFRAMAFR